MSLWSRLKSTCIQVFRLFRDYCWNSSFFSFVSVIEFVNLNFNAREWQIVCDELESLSVKLLPKTCFFSKLTIIQRCRPMTYKRISINMRVYCWNSCFFRFASVIVLVNLNSNVCYRSSWVIAAPFISHPCLFFPRDPPLFCTLALFFLAKNRVSSSI